MSEGDTDGSWVIYKGCRETRDHIVGHLNKDDVSQCVINISTRRSVTSNSDWGKIKRRNKPGDLEDSKVKIWPPPPRPPVVDVVIWSGSGRKGHWSGSRPFLVKHSFPVQWVVSNWLLSLELLIMTLDLLLNTTVLVSRPFNQGNFYFQLTPP